MPKWACELEYIGKDFAGSQIQCKKDSERANDPDIRTVQGEVEKALCTLIKQDVRTIFSGRTDAGVNAKGQVFHFETDKDLEAKKFLYNINAILPSDLSIYSLRKVESRFHSQKSAKWRWYRYIINTRGYRSVWDLPALHLHKMPDIESMNKALEYLKGEHDFSSFKSSKSSNPATVCNVFYANASFNNGLINIDIVGDRFLYNMVRIVVGTLLELDKNSSLPSKMNEILNSRSRLAAGHTEIPDGLYLMKVGYDKNEDFVGLIESLR